MKKIYLFLVGVACFLQVKTTSAQENSYFQNNPLWKITADCSYGGFCLKHEFYNYYTKGDSLIDSLNYVQIFKRAQGSLTWNSSGPNFGCEGTFVHFETQPTCFIRSSNKQMYIRMPNDTAEKLLYDFDLEVGDTLPVTYNNYFYNVTVAAIDSIFTPYGYKKRFALAGSTWSQYLIEGIGHSRGLIEPLVNPSDCTFNLNCFGYNDSAYYPSAGLTCDVAIGIIEQKAKIESSVYPNPFSERTTFYFNASLNQPELILHSVLGQKVLTLKGNNSNHLDLERGELNSGVYFYEVKQNGMLISNGKLMIKN